MNLRFIAVIGSGSGYWGAGETKDQAIAKMRKAGCRLADVKKASIYQFSSELPFAPANREAEDDEADCWVGQDGSMNWIRCDRTKT